MITYQRKLTLTALVLLITTVVFSGCSGSVSGGKSGGLLTPTNGKLEIPVTDVSDGKAHHYQSLSLS
jgi:hypothetical protein